MLCDRIEKLRKSTGLSARKFAEELGVKYTTYYGYEKGTREPGSDFITKLALRFGVSTDYILGISNTTCTENSDSVGTPYIPKGQMPILGYVAAGMPLYAEENIEGYCANDFDDGEDYFALRVRGDSMNACGINDGDLVVVRKQSMVDNGNVAVVAVNGDYATVKYFRQDGNMVVLSPKSYNEKHQTQIYNTKETPIHIIGRVMEARKKF